MKIFHLLPPASVEIFSEYFCFEAAVTHNFFLGIREHFTLKQNKWYQYCFSYMATNRSEFWKATISELNGKNVQKNYYSF
jgi:hypothetical protein